MFVVHLHWLDAIERQKISGVARNLCTGVLNYAREARAQNN